MIPTAIIAMNAASPMLNLSLGAVPSSFPMLSKNPVICAFVPVSGSLSSIKHNPGLCLTNLFVKANILVRNALSELFWSIIVLVSSLLVHFAVLSFGKLLVSHSRSLLQNDFSVSDAVSVSKSSMFRGILYPTTGWGGIGLGTHPVGPQGTGGSIGVIVVGSIGLSH